MVTITSGQVQAIDNKGVADALNADCTNVSNSADVAVERETPRETDSKPIKKQRGGKRPGAGRKPDLVKRMIGSLKPTTAREVLEIVPVEKVIREIFERALKQRTLADLWDRAYGRPAQSVNVAGGMVHAHTAWRPLEKHSDDEVRLLDKISRKMADPPGSNAPQDGPQNQIESKPAIEAEIVESLGVEYVESPLNGKRELGCYCDSSVRTCSHWLAHVL